jgi:hypothetical protein
MRNLSVYDEDFNLKREPKEDELFDLALEISNKLKGKTTVISADAEELLYVEQGRIRGKFIKLMLFTNASIELISKCMDMKEELVVAYRELFFDTSLIRGQLGKTEMYEDIFYKYDEGSEEFAFGIMLRDAHLGGPEIVMAQFNIELNNYGVASYKDREQQLLMWQLKETDRGDRDYEALEKQIKTRKSVMATIKDAAATEGKHKMSDLAALTKIITEMSDADMRRGEIEVRAYDLEKEEVIEAEVAELPAPEKTDEEEN